MAKRKIPTGGKVSRSAAAEPFIYASVDSFAIAEAPELSIKETAAPVPPPPCRNPSEIAPSAKPQLSAARRTGRRRSRPILWGALAVIILIAAAFALVGRFHSYPSGEAIVTRVGKLMILPDEDPMIYSIQDQHSLVTRQAFFDNAEKGDILLLFVKSKMAVIYSPARDIIVNVGPVAADARPPVPEASTTSATTTKPI